MSLSRAGASVSLAFKNPCSTARLPGSESSFYSVEEFQGCESSALTEASALGWAGTNLCPPELVLQAGLWLRQGCADIAMQILVSGPNPHVLLPPLSCLFPAPLLSGICQWRLKVRDV